MWKYTDTKPRRDEADATVCNRKCLVVLASSVRGLMSLLLCVLASVLLPGSAVLGQSSQKQEGLAALSDDALMNELAARGLDSLLEYAFEVNNVPQSERQGRRTLIALSRLSDPSSRLSPAQRQQLVAEIVRGIENALPAINDPNLLMRQASVLITQGVEREINTLEYWGENPRTQATVRPIVQTVIKILEKCARRAREQSEEFANQIKDPNSPYIARYEQAERLAATAEYTRHMVAYYLALSIDPASPQRKQVASEALEYLRQFDVPENPDRAMVRNRMAKLAMTLGDFATARKLFEETLNDQAEPPPTVAQQYEARYFIAVTELLAKNIAAARQNLSDLLAWQNAHLPQDQAARDGADAAAAMLDYRIKALEAELARDPAAREQASRQALKVLMDLVARRPDLRGIIYEQLLPRMDEAADLTKVDALMLRALIARGEQELRRPRQDQIDRQAIERAIDAAQEVIRRRGSAEIDGQMMDAAALLVPFFLERLDRRPEAADAFIHYAEEHKRSNPDKARLALDNAQALIGELRADPQTREDAAVTRAYERFLPVAIAEPFNRREFAFEYARRLQLNGRLEEAVQYYRLVPADDKRALEARFLQLLAIEQQLADEPVDSPRRGPFLAEIQKLADDVNAAAQASLASASSQAEQLAARSMLARTSLLAAELARREQKNPQRALTLLGDFEQAVQALPNRDELLREAMNVRVRAYMALEQYNQATEQLVQLLNRTDGARGAQIVYNLLEKLNADFDRAQQAGDVPAMKSLARNRAQLSGFLVDWAANNTDPNIRRFTYRYRVFDAEAQRRAADLEHDDPKAREAGLQLALQRYQALESAQNLALYRQMLDPKAAGDAAYDPQVVFGMALIHFELGNYEQAAEGFSRLLVERKLGTAVIETVENGQMRIIDNDQYWEAILKLIRSNQKLGRGGEAAGNYLKQQYIVWGQRVGGRKWKQDFEQLRRELIPDFAVPSATAPSG